MGVSPNVPGRYLQVRKYRARYTATRFDNVQWTISMTFLDTCCLVVSGRHIFEIQPNFGTVAQF